MSLWLEKTLGRGRLTAGRARPALKHKWFYTATSLDFLTCYTINSTLLPAELNTRLFYAFFFNIQPLLYPARVYGSCRVYTTQNSSRTRKRIWDQAAASSLISLHVSGFTQDTACLLILFAHMLALAMRCSTRHNVPSEDYQVFHSSHYSHLNGWGCHKEWLLSCGRAVAPKWDSGVTAYLRVAPWPVSESSTVRVVYRVLMRRRTQESEGPPWKKIYGKQRGKWSFKDKLKGVNTDYS